MWTNTQLAAMKICNDCSKTFASDHAMRQHHRDKHGPNAKPAAPKKKHHTIGKQRIANLNYTSGNQQPAEKSAIPTNECQTTNHQSQKPANDKNPIINEAQSKLHEYYKTVQPTKEDRIESRNLIRDKVLKPLLEGINQDKENLYKGSLEKAGSTATNTKVNKADEFDFDLHLNINDTELDKSNIGYELSTKVIRYSIFENSLTYNYFP